MKTAGFVFITCLLITFSVSAQTNLALKPGSVKFGYNSFQKSLTDTLKLENPFNENKLQSPSFRYRFPRREQNFAQNFRFANPYRSNFKMPVIRPSIKSNMPVAKPDSSVHYFIQILKTEN